MKFIEKTLVLIKPDAVSRGIAGSILERFERVGLKIVGLKLVQPKKEQLDVHFPIHDKEWITSMGKKSLENYAKFGMDPVEEIGTKEPFEIGMIILGWNYEYLLSGPVVAIVLEGPRAVSVIRKIIGHTVPAEALPGTIRGDFSINSADFSNSQGTSCKNIVHASGNLEEAKKECAVWFKKEELISYVRADEKAMFFGTIKRKGGLTMVTTEKIGTVIENIEDVYEKMKVSDPRKAAEIAYVIAMKAKAKGDNEKAIRFGKESVRILDELNVQTMEECATFYVVLNGIGLPEFIHSDMIRDRMKPLTL